MGEAPDSSWNREAVVHLWRLSEGWGVGPLHENDVEMMAGEDSPIVCCRGSWSACRSSWSSRDSIMTTRSNLVNRAGTKKRFTREAFSTGSIYRMEY